MNKSNEYRGKNGKYFTDQEELNLVKFGKLWTLNRWGGITGSTEQYAPYDAHMTRADKKYVIELKDRTVDHNNYQTAFIEFEKYNGLMHQYEEYGYIPLYICFYTDGYARVFPILQNPCPQTWKKNNAVNRGYWDATENNECYILSNCNSYVYRYE